MNKEIRMKYGYTITSAGRITLHTFSSESTAQSSFNAWMPGEGESGRWIGGMEQPPSADAIIDHEEPESEHQ